MNFLYKLGCFFLYKKTPAPINKIPNITKKIINIVDILSEFDSFFNSKIFVSFVKKTYYFLFCIKLDMKIFKHY